MYKKILTAVNEYVSSEVAAKYALGLARACGCKLYLCFVAENGAPEENFNRADEALERLLRQADTLGIEAEIIRQTGDPVRKIAEMVRDEKIDVLFASTAREDLKPRFYIGTVARRLSRRLPCSVALVRVAHLGKIQPQKILVPLKARVDHVDERAYYAAKMAQAFGAEVLVFHTRQPVSGFRNGADQFSLAPWEKQLPPDIAHFIERLEKYRVIHREKVAPGHAGSLITVEAFTKRHDLIILGASQRGRLRALFRGSPVEEVLRETPCDLIIFRPHHEDT